MRIVLIYQVDTFATRRFAGNPAAVMVLDQFLDDATLQAIAAETLFLKPLSLWPRARTFA